MQIKKLHSWDISVKEAVKLQRGLSPKVKMQGFNKKIKTIAGIDCAFRADGEKIIACVVVLAAENFDVIETVYAVRGVKFPYISGFLSFREAPACLAAWEKLKTRPDCVIVDGQGIAHPRRLGLACHLGLFIDIPTIGCAKSRLIGDFTEPGLAKGSTSALINKGKTIGSVVRSRDNVKPLFVSVGHKCRLSDAVRIVLDCCVKYRLPEPSRIAHQTVTKLKLKIEY
ncbi:MAG: deoxyribonuclease V [Sedimentisphaerales bacterium]|nr:deoxyribonuclease V [Sedimentisphaerales bacterium]